MKNIHKGVELMPFEVIKLDMPNIKGKTILWDDRIEGLSVAAETNSILSKVKPRNSILIKLPEWNGKENEEEYICQIKKNFQEGLNKAIEKKISKVSIPITKNNLNGGVVWRDLAALESVVVDSLIKSKLDIELLIENNNEDLLEKGFAKDMLDYVLRNFQINRKLSSIESSPNLMELCTIYGATDLIIPKKEEEKKIAYGAIQEGLAIRLNELNLTVEELSAKTGLDEKIIYYIKNNLNSVLQKEELISLVVGLEMDSKKARDVLKKAGYQLTASSKADLIFAYFIDKMVGSVYLLKLALFQSGQSTNLSHR